MNIVALVIIILGLLNVSRLAIFFILGDIYDIRQLKKNRFHKDSSTFPFFTILIAAYNEEKVIKRTLESISRLNYKNYEVIVIDDGSKDKTRKKVEMFKKNNSNFPITLYQQNNSGKANALNTALRKVSRNGLIMTLDADSVVDENALYKSVKYFKDPKVVGIASNIKIINTDSFMGLIQTVEYLLGHRLKKAFTISNMEYVIGGIGAIFRKDILDRVKYYDTDTVTEDIDLTMKIIQLGNIENKIMFAEDVICYTEAPVTIQGLYKQRLRWKYGRFQTLFKNRNLFFNSKNKYSKLLTFFYLPFILFSEFIFLFDPFLLIFIIFLSITYHTFDSLLGVFFFYFFYSALTILDDRYLSSYEKLLLVLVSPLSYMFFSIISFIEYAGLIMCMIGYKGILSSNNKKTSWEHVERVG